MRRLGNAHRLLRLAALSTSLALAPLAFSWSHGVRMNDACAGNGCCFHPHAICETGNGNYDGYENKSVIQIIFGCPD
jgi:hypothetical protein